MERKRRRERRREREKLGRGNEEGRRRRGRWLEVRDTKMETAGRTFKSTSLANTFFNQVPHSSSPFFWCFPPVLSYPMAFKPCRQLLTKVLATKMLGTSF